MADKTVPDAICAQQAPELRIEIWRDEWAQFEGTASQLTAEGLIPEGFKWPQAASDMRWTANGFDYWLRRTRPEGHKGPMSSWLELDNWFVRVDVEGRDHRWCTRRKLERQAEELRKAFHRQTRAGQAEWDAEWRRYWDTRRDEAFQAFKAKVPGLIPPKRGRKPKAQSAEKPGPSA